MQIPEYCKYTYWLTHEEFSRLRDRRLPEKGIEMKEAKKAVCTPLTKRVETGFVSPDSWDKYPLCKRQLSWYKSSHNFDLTLVISSTALEEFALKPETIIRERKFRPPELPSRDQKLAMIQKESYQKAKPAEWENIEAEDPQLQERWMKIMGLRGVSYEELFITHCANHANFIEPQYFIEEDNAQVPYSIAKTSRICSACLEFFNIIGSRLAKKLVVPCPGAVLFAGMSPNRYYEVTCPAAYGG